MVYSVLFFVIAILIRRSDSDGLSPREGAASDTDVFVACWLISQLAKWIYSPFVQTLPFSLRRTWEVQWSPHALRCGCGAFTKSDTCRWPSSDEPESLRVGGGAGRYIAPYARPLSSVRDRSASLNSLSLDLTRSDDELPPWLQRSRSFHLPRMSIIEEESEADILEVPPTPVPKGAVGWDTNGDLQANAWDTTGDGRVDAWDTTGDGLIDRVHRSSHMRTEPLLHEAVDGLPSRPLSLSPVRPRTSVESATAHNEMLPRSPPTLSEAEIDALSAVAEILDGANQQLQQDEEANQQLQEEHADSITSESSTAIMV